MSIANSNEQKSSLKRTLLINVAEELALGSFVADSMYIVVLKLRSFIFLFLSRTTTRSLSTHLYLFFNDSYL